MLRHRTGRFAYFNLQRAMSHSNTQAVRWRLAMRAAIKAALVPALTILCRIDVHAQTPPASPGRIIARAGTEFEARADGVACAPRVKVFITATDAKSFEGDIPPAAKFFSNARAGHSLSCPQMSRMVAQGRSNGKVMFTAMADQTNGWEALILGSSADGRAEETALATGGPTQKSVFRSSQAFTTATEVLTQTKDKFLCLAGTKLACDVILKFTPAGPDKTTTVYRQALSGGKSAAVVASTATMRDGFFCGDPNTASVTIEDAQMSEDAKRDYADQLLERVKANGEVCTGFSNQANAMTAYGFDASGKGVDKPRAVSLSTNMPAFALAK